MTWRAAMAATSRATVGRARWWAVALAAFLVRGGLFLLLPPIVVLPTPAELALAIVNPNLTGAGVGSLGPELPRLIVILVAAAGLLCVAAGFVGAWLEVDLLGEVAASDRLTAIGRPLRIPVGRALAARLIAHLPTLLVAAAGTVVLAAAAYAELLDPSGTGSLVGRVALRAPAAVGAIVGTWLVGEAWGGLAIRRLGLGEALGPALLGGLAGMARPSSIATLVATTLAVAAPVAILWLAASQAYGRLWPLLVDGADPRLVVVALGLFVATWAAGLWLLAIALAWRSAAWTAEALRRA
jgi:hypothetical protein